MWSNMVIEAWLLPLTILYDLPLLLLWLECSFFRLAHLDLWDHSWATGVMDTVDASCWQVMSRHLVMDSSHVLMLSTCGVIQTGYLILNTTSIPLGRSRSLYLASFLRANTLGLLTICATLAMRSVFWQHSPTLMLDVANAQVVMLLLLLTVEDEFRFWIELFIEALIMMSNIHMTQIIKKTRISLTGFTFIYPLLWVQVSLTLDGQWLYAVGIRLCEFVAFTVCWDFLFVRII